MREIVNSRLVSRFQFDPFASNRRETNIDDKNLVRNERDEVVNNCIYKRMKFLRSIMHKIHTNANVTKL